MNKITDFPKNVQDRIVDQLMKDMYKSKQKLWVKLIKEVTGEKLEKGSVIRDSRKAPKYKRDVCPRSLDKKEGNSSPAYHCFAFISVRKRLADYDNLSGKACVDQLVKEGLLRNDGAEIVDRSPQHRQLKAGKGRPERTKVLVYKWTN